SFDSLEVYRLLKPDGQFVTQQIGGLNDCELNLWLGSAPSIYSNWKLKKAVSELKSVGFNIVETKEDITLTRFYDVGAIVYYLKVISRQVENFSVAAYKERLYAIQEHIQSYGYLDVTNHRFLIIAKK
ncbi:MAG: hypothetical protein ACRCST_14295, partial [Turicibacter sp.]